MNAATYLTRLAEQLHRGPRSAPRDGLQALLARMGHPEQRVRCVHIAGSKGKGSTALMLEAMLRAGGRHTGVFTSPHIERWNERIRLAGKPVADAEFDAILVELQPHVAQLRQQCARGPDFFEVLLVAALCLFERADVDEAIIEAGIGARFDATAVVRPVATALTSVELEHTVALGDDLAAIAMDKAAVTRPGVPLVSGPLPPAAARVVQAQAAAVHAPLLQPRAQRVAATCAVMGDGCELALPAPSQAQADCAAVAYGCLRALNLFADPAPVARQGMDSVVLPGRQEILGRQPLLVADSAHTRGSMTALLEALQVWGLAQAPLVLVLSGSGRRNLARLAAPLLAHAERIYVTRADAAHSVDPQPLAAALRLQCPDGVVVQVIEAPAAALAAACAQAPTRGIVCATGSAYMAGAARRFLGSDKSA